MIANGWGGNPHPRKQSPGKRIICVANLRPEKRHDLLIQAFASAVRQHPDAELILVGDGPLRTQLEDQVRELNLTARVTFTGAVTDVWPLLADADVFALSSQYETLGIAVLEAMAAGLPAVVTGVGGLVDVVEPGETGLLVPAGRPDEFAAALIQLLDSPAERLRMGAAAQLRAADQRAEQMVERYLDLYRYLAAE
jgi:glycosyltransferase involved in cell wall biosynthesis